jgi:hypothetical protein
MFEKALQRFCRPWLSPPNPCMSSRSKPSNRAHDVRNSWNPK